MKWFNNLKISQKLISSFIAISLFIGIVGYAGIRSMRIMNTNSSTIYNLGLKGVDSIDTIKGNIIQMDNQVLLMLNTNNKYEIQNLKTQLLQLIDSNNKLLSNYKETITIDKDKQLFNRFETIFNDYKNDINSIVSLIEKGKYKDAKKYISEISEHKNDMYSNLNEEVQLNIQLSESYYNNSINAYEKSFILIIIFIILGLLFAITLGLVI